MRTPKEKRKGKVQRKTETDAKKTQAINFRHQRCYFSRGLLEPSVPLTPLDRVFSTFKQFLNKVLFQECCVCWSVVFRWGWVRGAARGRLALFGTEPLATLSLGAGNHCLRSRYTDLLEVAGGVLAGLGERSSLGCSSPNNLCQ
ncbi:UNVERIFIED_CONTAM: hypothetical protein K2H54_073888 [Gekko kuhli]